MSRLRYHPVAPSLVAAFGPDLAADCDPDFAALRAWHDTCRRPEPVRREAPVGRRLPVNFVDFIREA